MASYAGWGTIVVVAVVLGLVARHFSLRSVRRVAAVIAVILVIAITKYGLGHWHAAQLTARPSNLANAFTAGADALIAACLRPLLGDYGTQPGPIGRAVIAVALVIGYRALESFAMRRQAPQLNSVKLSDDQPGGPAGAGGESDVNLARAQQHAQLTAELGFRLAAIDVRAPAILPGGSRVSGLASIAETSGVSGAGFAGAVIRFLGSVWPNPRQLRLRVWVEPPQPQPLPAPQPQPGQAADCKVTVYLENPRNGETAASKTLASLGVDEAASLVAGYVARQIFVLDPDTPPWCYGRADGADLGALLLTRLERAYAETPRDVAASRDAQIRRLCQWADGGKAAGVARYELAQLLDLDGDHLGALRLHARNLADYPRFYRGLYRLGMSLEMVANPGQRFPDDEDTGRRLDAVLDILRREHYLAERTAYEDGDLRRCDDDPGYCTLSPSLRLDLLIAAAGVLRAVRAQLSPARVGWATFRHRDERRIWQPYWPWWLLGSRGVDRWAFHDGVCVAEVLVAIRIKLIGRELATADDGPGDALHKATIMVSENWRHYRRGVTTASRIAGEAEVIGWVLSRDERWTAPGQAAGPAGTPRHGGKRPAGHGTKRAPGNRSSWQAAYNAACLYAALARQGLAEQERVVTCLRRTVDSPHSELEHPSDWMSQDPDLVFLADPDPARPGERTPFQEFLDAQERLDYPAAFPAQPQPQPQPRPRQQSRTQVQVPGQRPDVPQAALHEAGDQPVTGEVTS